MLREEVHSSSSGFISVPETHLSALALNCAFGTQAYERAPIWFPLLDVVNLNEAN